MYVSIVIIIYLFGPSQPVSCAILIPISLSLFVLSGWATLIFGLLGIVATFGVYLIDYQPLILLDTSQARLLVTLLTWGCTLLIPTLIGLLLSKQLSELKQVNQFAITQATNLQAAFNSIEDKRHFGEGVGQRMASVTSELQAIASQQAGGSQQQVTTLAQVTQFLSELLATAGSIEGKSQTIAQSAGQVLDLTQKVQATTNTVQEAGTQGLRAVERTLETNQEIDQLYNILTEGLALLQERTEQIRQIMDNLKNISDQTHLLALNAALEAAGAGAAEGQRFKVVATEVRKLADRSRAASTEAGQILGKVSEGIIQVANTARSGQQQTEQALAVAEESGLIIRQLINVIDQNIHEVSDIEQAAQTMNRSTQEISLATGQQRGATSQAVLALQELGAVAQQTASGSQQVKKTSVSLEELSHELVLTLAV